MRSNGRNTRADDFVRTAAFLKREFEGRKTTVEFIEKDNANRTIYVFDSDVIKTKCAPWITGPIGETDNNGYGAIFFNDSNESLGSELDRIQQAKQAESIASILASYVLNQQIDRVPIFQFPSHATETNNVYRAVRRTVETFEKVDFRRTQLRRTFELSRAIALVRHRLPLVQKRTTCAH